MSQSGDADRRRKRAPKASRARRFLRTFAQRICPIGSTRFGAVLHQANPSSQFLFTKSHFYRMQPDSRCVAIPPFGFAPKVVHLKRRLIANAAYVRRQCPPL
jgi:hypothetical protein